MNQLLTLLALAVSVSVFAADIDMKDLPAAAPASTSKFPFVDSNGRMRNASAAALRALMGGGSAGTATNSFNVYSTTNEAGAITFYDTNGVAIAGYDGTTWWGNASGLTNVPGAGGSGSATNVWDIDFVATTTNATPLEVYELDLATNTTAIVELYVTAGSDITNWTSIVMARIRRDTNGVVIVEHGFQYDFIGTLTINGNLNLNGDVQVTGRFSVSSPDIAGTNINTVNTGWQQNEGAVTNLGAVYGAGQTNTGTIKAAAFDGNSATATTATNLPSGTAIEDRIAGATNGTVAKATSAVNSTNFYGTITASQVSDPENFAWSAVSNNTGVITMGKFNTTNITGDITMGLLSGLSASGWKNGALYITNSTADDHSVTFNATIRLSTNTFVLGQVVWVTNKSDVLVAIGHTAYSGTNAAATRWPKQ